MAKLNTCEKCGHYSWVHKDGQCGLHYCPCGKLQANVSPTEAVDTTAPKSRDPDATILPRDP